MFFVFWGTFKSAESLLRISGTRDIYSFYGLEWLYYSFVVLSVIGGVALAYAIIKTKPWGYVLGFIWLLVGIVNTLFTGFISYVNKPLMIKILTITNESRGRDISNIENFVNSSAYQTTMVGSTIILLCIMLFFMFNLYKNREYFNKQQE